MEYKRQLPTDTSFTTNDLMGFVYSDASDYPGIDALKIFADGHSGKATTGPYDRVYLILAGDGEFIIEGKRMAVTKDDVVVLPKNTSYEYSGSMELFEVNAPAFRPSA